MIEFFINGRELANGFSELNDSEDQAERFRAQVAQKDSGDLEAMFYDADFIRALAVLREELRTQGLHEGRVVVARDLLGVGDGLAHERAGLGADGGVGVLHALGTECAGVGGQFQGGGNI